MEEWNGNQREWSVSESDGGKETWASDHGCVEAGGRQQFYNRSGRVSVESRVNH